MLMLRPILPLLLHMQCCGSGMFIPDPNFSILDPGSKNHRIPDLGSTTKNLEYF
jgi:hypothetical protein